MQKTGLKFYIIFIFCLILSFDKSFAELSTAVSTDENITSEINAIFIKDDNSYYNQDFSVNILNAADKFIQRNIRASRNDFKNIIEKISQNDFYYLVLANKNAELGFYDLADLAFSKIKDKSYTEMSQNDIKIYYYPKSYISSEDEIFLAQIYSDIMYNNQSSEAVDELMKNKKFADTDYANYLVSLGFYKSNDYKNAMKYINKAILLNPQNINFQVLKAKIYADNKKEDEAIKIVKAIKNYDIKTFVYKNKIEALESYVLYKTKKPLGEKNYYLANYYYTEKDYSKALKALQAACADKKNGQKDEIYGMMSEIFFLMQDCNKASEYALKAVKFNKKDNKALITLGDLSYKEKNYEKALEYYKKASKTNKKDDSAIIKTAKTFYELNNQIKTKSTYEKIFKCYPYSWNAYYELALITPEKTEKENYLKKSLSINPNFSNTWAELAHIEIDNGNFEKAEKYLSNACYIDENSFKYYYYQGILCKKIGDLTKAKYNFKKCLKINEGNPNAQRELDNIVNMEEQDTL